MGYWDEAGRTFHNPARTVTPRTAIRIPASSGLRRFVGSMAAIIKADLQRIDTALRAGLSHRGSLARLRAGSIEAWGACSTSLADATCVLTNSAFDDPGESAAATWVHWRKSSTSKQLLSLLQTVIEEVHVAEPAAAGSLRSYAAHSSIYLINFFFMHTRSAALWPAMRGWLLEQGGMQSVWTALAWCLASRERGASSDIFQIRSSVHAALALTVQQLLGVNATSSLPQHPGVGGALKILLSEILPRDFAAGNTHLWCLREMLSSIASIADATSAGPSAAASFGASSLASQLHQPLLVAWPYLIAALRRSKQQPCVKDAEDNVEVCPCRSRLCKACRTDLILSVTLALVIHCSLLVTHY